MALQKTLEQQNRDRELKAQVMKRFKHIRHLISEGELNDAEKALAELRSLDDYAEDIKSLHELIELARKLNTDTTELALNRQLILKESTDAMKLPDRYNTELKRDAPDPYNEPPSPLEELLDRKISMKITDMPLQEFAMQLGSLEGLNVADPMNVVFSNDAIKDKKFSANFKDVPLRALFEYISRNLGVDFNVVGNLIWVTASTNKDATGAPLETRIIPLRNGIIPKVPEGIAVNTKVAFTSGVEEDTDLETALKNFYAKSKTGGSYTIFPTRNMLIINDTLANIRKVEKLVKALDKAPCQVVIEARFMTVSQKDLRDVGAEIKHYNGGKTGEKIEADNSHNANISDFLTQLGTIESDNVAGYGGLSLSGIIGNRSFDLILTAIENKTSTVTISAPRITTLNNRTARIRKGDKKYYFEQYTLQTVDHGDAGSYNVLVPSGKPSSLALGITFDVKVNIGNDGKTILLGLKPEIINFIQWEDYTSSETTTANKVTTTTPTQVMLPRTHEQTIAASVAINSGETVILGGMVENTEARVLKKIPLLGDIPYLGKLFQHVTESSEPTNLLIFVTATIINEKGEYVIVND